MMAADTLIRSEIIMERNYADLPFVLTGQEEQANRVLMRTARAMQSTRSVSVGQLLPSDRLKLGEEGLLPEHTEHDSNMTLLFLTGSPVTLLVNNGCHAEFRLIRHGVPTEADLTHVQQQADILCRESTMAYDPKLGYLTACPPYCGCGTQISFILHLPMIQTAGEDSGFTEELAKEDILLEALDGDMQDAQLFLLTNLRAVGLAPIEILVNLTEALEKLTERERYLREEAALQRDIRLSDQVFRAWGLAGHARLLSVTEALGIWSDLRLGAMTGLLPLRAEPMLSWLQALRPGHMKATPHAKPDETEALRAGLMRSLMRKAALPKASRQAQQEKE